MPLVMGLKLTSRVAELKPPGPLMRTSWLSRVDTSVQLSYVTVNEYNVPPATVTFVVVAFAVG